jgi:hypothetical protein
MTVEMKEASTYEGWDFAKVWKISPSVNGGYPGINILGLSISTSPSEINLNQVKGATSTIVWKITGLMENCKTIGTTYGGWTGLTVNPSYGTYSKDIFYPDYITSTSDIYGIECVAKDGTIVMSSTTVNVVGR